MARRRLFWQVFSSYLFIIAATSVAGTLYTAVTLRQFYWDQADRDLTSRAALVEVQLRALLERNPGANGEVNRLAQQLGQAAGMRVTFVLPDGAVVGDSEDPPTTMDNHANRPEIRAALESGQGRAVRFSRSVQSRMAFVARRIDGEDGPLGVVRVGVAASPLRDALSGLAWEIGAAGAVISVLAALLSWYVARRVTRPLEMLKKGAETLAEGHLRQRLPVSRSAEIGGLGEALNHMAAELDDRITTLLEQRNEQDAVLSSMVEGVIAVDNDERLISMNRAAVHWLGVEMDNVQGQSVPAVVRNSGLQKFVKRALSSAAIVEDEFASLQHDRRVLQARGTALRDGRGERIGAVIVLNDVTRLRRLEEVRRDFVANVSHELKTPITSIKGFVETLRDGAINDPEAAARFLDILAKQADRLNAIIDDLLTLSRLEQEEEGEAESILRVDALRPVLEESIVVCRRVATGKNMGIELYCDPALQARMNAPLLGQGVTNLVDNAIKYGDADTTVTVEAEQTDEEICIHVRDRGRGIPSEHLPRIFERFYRVDKDRSRAQGGTGLGLSIVRHIAQTHEGSVTVTSTPGKGSTFTIHLPIPRAAPHRGR